MATVQHNRRTDIDLRIGPPRIDYKSGSVYGALVIVTAPQTKRCYRRSTPRRNLRPLPERSAGPFRLRLLSDRQHPLGARVRERLQDLSVGDAAACKHVK